MRHELINARGDKSRRDVARDLGITPQMVGYLERGDRNPSWDLAKQFSVYYEKSIEELFFNQNRNDSFLEENTSA